MKHPITQFRLVALGEGISYLLLLGWGMPLKYMYGQPETVRILGSIHGGLFVLFVITLVRAALYGKWSIARIAEAILASLIPFGTFYLEWRYHPEFSAPVTPALASRSDRDPH